MRRAFCVWLVTMLSMSLAYAGGPVTSAPYGLVAFEKGIDLAPGTTIFGGSEVATPPDGYATIFLTEGRARLEVYGNSKVTFAGSSREPLIKLTRGGLRLSVESTGRGSQVLVLGALVRLAGSGAREAEVRLIAPNRLSVAAITCPVVLEAGAEVLTIPKGSLYHIIVADPAPQGAAGNGSTSAKRRRALWVIFGVSIGVATGVGIYLNNREHAAPAFVSPAVP